MCSPSEAVGLVGVVCPVPPFCTAAVAAVGRSGGVTIPAATLEEEMLRKSDRGGYARRRKNKEKKTREKTVEREREREREEKREE